MNWDKKGSIYYLINSDKIKSKIASFDLDYTLIKPHKSVHPKDINDWELCFDTLKEKLMNETLKNNGRVVIDNTHSNVKSREPYLDMAKKYNEKVLCIFIDINKEQSMFLNNFRCKLTKKRKLPDVVIHTFFKKFEAPLINEGIEKIVKKGFTPDFNKYNETLFNHYF